VMATISDEEGRSWRDGGVFTTQDVWICVITITGLVSYLPQ